MTLPAAVKERLSRRVGTVIKTKYRLNRLIGVGGMAAVYEATHRNGSRVAIKLLHAEISRVAELRARFLREGYVANKVGHAGVVKVLDDDVDDEGAVFLVMELLEGETLESRWERYGQTLPLAEVLLHADHLLDVLEAGHQQGIIHRDIKPENIFLTRDGVLKVLDFGIARLLDGTGMTGSGQLMGTPAFMPPEQAAGRTRQIDHRTDIWAAGATMFTLLSGRHVHEQANAAMQLVHSAGMKARSLAIVAPDIPKNVVGIVDRALAFERDDRWPSATMMQAALRATFFYDIPKTQLIIEATGNPSPVHVAHTSSPTLRLGSVEPEDPQDTNK
jgi:serine/threonine protein kinase